MSDPIACALQGALLVDRPDLGTLVVTGSERQSWLNGMITADLADLSDQRAVYSLTLNKKGKILSDLIVLKLRDALMLAADGSGCSVLSEELDRFLVMEDAELAIESEPCRWVIAYGPLAADLALRAREQLNVRAAAMSIAGCQGAVFFALGDAAESLRQRLLAFASDAVCLVDAVTFDQCRIELGIPRFGHDFGASSYPQEIGLDDRAISFTKGCYIGQEVVVKMRSRGHPSRQLVRLRFPAGGDLAGAGEAVTTESDESVGAVTSIARWASTDRVMAFALVRRSDLASGKVLYVKQQRVQVLDAWGPVDALT